MHTDIIVEKINVGHMHVASKFQKATNQMKKNAKVGIFVKLR